MPNRSYTIEEINTKKPLNSLLTAQYYTGRRGKNGSKYVMCICECGTTKDIQVAKIINGHSRSCGCIYGISRIGISLKYSSVHYPIRSCYDAMMSRCYDERNIRHKDYGGRGVIVCDEWKNNYQNFLDWALVNGWAKGLQIDKDIIPKRLGVPALLYSPEMCCFVTPSVNCNNRTSNVYVNYNGQEMSLKNACDTGGFNYKLVSGRVYMGWTFEEAITIPKGQLRHR